MSKMQKLYEKVAADSGLQAKFTEIMRGAEEAGKETTEEKLVSFAKETGFDVTPEEIFAFFKNLSEKTEGVLSDEDLDQVAGGKSTGGIVAVVTSVLGLGISCVFMSAGAEMSEPGSCGEIFE